MKKSLLFTLFLFAGHTLFAQCVFDSTITSDPILSGGNEIQCSDQEIVFTAPAGYDSYQWKYKFSPTGTATNFDGETNNSLSIIAGDLGFGYVFVTITDSGCTEASNDIMFDTFIFVSPAISHDSDTVLCIGETSVISNAFNGPENFRWYRNGVLVLEGSQDFYEVSEAGDYILEVSYPQCPEQWLSNGVPVSFEVIGEQVEITETGGSLFTTQGGDVYTWYLDETEITGANSFTYTPVSTGNYKVAVTYNEQESCTIDSLPFFFTVLSITDFELNGIFFDNTIAVDDQFVLQNAQLQPLTYFVFDLSGKQLVSKRSNTGQIIIEAQNWKNGIYFCKIVTPKGSMNVKLMR